MASLAVAVACAPAGVQAQDGWTPHVAFGGGVTGYPDAFTVMGRGAATGTLAGSVGARHGYDDDVGLSLEAGYHFEGGGLPDSHYASALIGVDYAPEWFQLGVAATLLLGAADGSLSAGARLTPRIELLGALSVDLGYEVRGMRGAVIHGFTSMLRLDLGLIVWGIVQLVNRDR